MTDLSEADLAFGGGIAAARAALRRGDFLAAYDFAMSAREAGDDDPDLDFIAVLALARMGDADIAMELYDRAGLGKIDNDDIRALSARLKKDIAQLAPEAERPALFAEASRAYHEIFDDLGGYFPAINAATTAMLAGDEGEAEALAREILTDPEIVRSDCYYAAASAAEAHLLLGDGDAAVHSIDTALGWPDADPGSRASTFRQFELIARSIPALAPLVAPLLDRLRPPPVAVFSGHMFVSDEAAERRIADAIGHVLDETGVRVAYGALACGADILVAEALLVRRGELHVVLPFQKDDFVAQSVTPGGAGWEQRFENCLAAATSVSYATDVAYIGDPMLFSYGAAVTMGLARMRAQHLQTEAVQIAVLTHDDKGKIAGTATDVAFWKSLGHSTLLIEPGEIDRRLATPTPVEMPANVERVAYSFIFADFAGFSQLTEAELPLFASEVMGRIGEVLDAFEEAVLYRNSWGDALYAVIRTPSEAAEIALRLQERLQGLPDALIDGSENCGMRIGVHHGPIYRAYDRVMQRSSFFGTEVTRTARIEPVTPPGEVYATEAFASMLALEPELKFGTHYVGRIQLAKGYGELSMYKLSPAGEA